MGWGSGVDVFDPIISAILGTPMNIGHKKALIKAVITALEDHDWDTQPDSKYWDHHIVREVFRELSPDWFEDE
jgi:hypothetical protein